MRNPTRDQVVEAIRTANANAYGKSRLCELPPGLADQILSTPQGCVELDGGSVPKCYRYAAKTSYTIAAWYTDQRGVKHVRIEGARVVARKTRYGEGSGVAHTDATGWAVVYPERAKRWRVRMFERTQKTLQRLGLRFHRLAMIAAHGDDGLLLLVDDVTSPKWAYIVGREICSLVPTVFGDPRKATHRRLRARGGRAAVARGALEWAECYGTNG